MGCKYCRSESFENIGKGQIKKDGVTIDLNKLKDDSMRISLLAQDFFDIPILKISGYGEFFVLPETIKLLKSVSPYYERIQIITNATRLDERYISRLSEIPGINICISLDGHTPELNFCRTTNKKLIDKILDNIEILRKYKIPVEVNSVLTKYNISKFIEFIDYLSKRYDSLICYPFPVRGEDELSALGPENAERLIPLLDSDKYGSRILPPRAYVERLISFVSNRKRQDRCFIGYSNLGIDPAGNILICACNIKKAIGNIFIEDPLLAMKRRMSHPLFYKFFFPNLSFNGCIKCFTHYEIINLYLDGTLTLKEIARIPLFSGKKTQKRLKELKNKLNPLPSNSEKSEKDFGTTF
jgi:MoaA/NifB/PqqE/SkfB family radical SAM enzyme